jgi:hypothetical protein
MTTMKLKYVLPILTVAAAHVSAEEYQLFTNLHFSHIQADVTLAADDLLFPHHSRENLWQLNGQYYFDKKQTLGALDQFEYINKVSNVSMGYAHAAGENFGAIGGEYFAANNLVLSAHFSGNADFHTTSVGVGYLISKDFIVRVLAEKPEEGDTSYLFSASYNLQLQGYDYIGFTTSVDDEFDYVTLSSKYFAGLENGRFIALGMSVADNNGSTAWNAGVDYYFSKMTSAGLSYGKDDNYSLNAKHYFNQSWALEAGFSSNADDSSIKVYSLGLSGQF